MTLKTLTHQTLALAGVAQSAALVQQFATKGTADNIALTCSIGSLLKISAESVLDVYGGNIQGLALGLNQLALQMSHNKLRDPEQARYAATLLFLERQLAKQPKMLTTIQIAMTKAQYQAEQFGLLHENVFANLGDAYHSTVSQLQPRIMVNGDSVYLSRSDMADKVRSCLLAGIRSALLWRQCGGNRWQLLFGRKKLFNELERLKNMNYDIEL